MSELLQSKHIALLATHGFEDSELQKPLEAVQNAGAKVTILSVERGVFSGKNGTEITADRSVSDATAGDYDGLILPGGVENPDHLRINDHAVRFIRDFFAQQKPVAAICHAPWLLIEANVLKGRTVTSWPSLKTDLKNAGADWIDQEVVVDDGLVTSRNPDDLPAFCKKMVEEFAEGVHTNQTL